jgi:hypothetical protein
VRQVLPPKRKKNQIWLETLTELLGDLVMQIVLEIRSGSLKGNIVRLERGRTLRFGRTSKVEHVFPDDNLMSGAHFAVDYDERGCHIRDLNSGNGTLLNGKKVAEAILQNRDEITAGRTQFLVRFEAENAEAPAPPPLAIQPLPAVPAPWQPLPQPKAAAPAAKPVSPAPPQAAQEPAAPQTPQERLLNFLRKEFQPLYALLDAAREPSVLKVIYESKEEYQSLYEGASGAQLAHFAPYLVRIPQKSPLMDTLVQQAWAKSWGVYLTCDQPLKDLRTHFRHFLIVKLPDGRVVNFRYYDPRVLRVFLPTCLPEEANQFFGPVKHFLVEAEDPNLALQFRHGANGAEKKEFRLGS